MFDQCFDVDYDPPEFFSETTPVARKQHKCCECCCDIMPGERYNCVSGKWDGEVSVHKTCSVCARIRACLFHSFIFTQMWEDIHEAYCDEEYCMCPDTRR